ncbi:MAG: nitrite reductase/ring-hydroxylating ferredoxin subunit [Candidatus Paceibacteria bacterium]|jgi:nitrite reductase/ring-hydroxylating ferredoxin subunit
MFKRLTQLFRGRPYRIQNIASLPEGQARAELVGDPFAGGAQIVLARVDGELHVLDSECPHAAEGHFDDGALVEGRYLLCPAHNYHFDPKTGKSVGSPCKKATSYKFELDGDDCLVYI